MGLSLGAYLSHPVTEKHSSNEENGKMVYGVSSMQGWRETQEDAHNCMLDFDSDASLFAVYDGHGGCEVSEYTSQHLPQFIKESEHYKNGDYENALKDSFVKFDCTLKDPKVIKDLQKLTSYNECNEEEEYESEEESSSNVNYYKSLGEAMVKYAMFCNDDKKTNSSEVTESSDKISKKSSEASSNETECSSSKSLARVNESDSEVSSSSSSCGVLRKSLAEKYNAGVKSRKSLLDSTSNGSEESKSSGSSQVDRINTCGVSNVETSMNQSKSNKDLPDSESDKEKKSSCNGESDGTPVEETISSSSVENGEVEQVKTSGKGKALVKPRTKQKVDREKEKESSEKLFQKFINSELSEEMSESDSDDVTFNCPESRSDDDDDDDDEDDDDDDDDEDDDDDDDDDEDEVDDEDGKEDGDDDDDQDEEEDEVYEYKNKMNQCFTEPGFESGCTALVALIKGKKLYVANAGDCRCVVSKNGEAIELSIDHKPESEIELSRIEKAGGRVNAGRVNDGLNLSRALGDHVYKRTPNLPPEEQMISPLPDIQVLNLEPDIEFMVLACDGIWNSMSSKEVVDFVRPRLMERSDNLSKICEELFDHCLAPNTLCDGTGCDNMTAIIVRFKDSNFPVNSVKKRSLEEETSEAEESIKKKQKTEDVTSTDSVDSVQSTGEGFSEKPSNSPDTTQ